jgi:hypothetical protein
MISLKTLGGTWKACFIHGRRKNVINIEIRDCGIGMILNFISYQISNINMAKTKAKKTKSGSKTKKK